MALTTYQGVLDGLRPPSDFIIKSVATGGTAGRQLTTWYAASRPVAGGVGATTPGTALTAPVTGQIPFTNPVSGESILAATSLSTLTTFADFMLVDRLWAMSGLNVTLTTAQTVNSVAWPARDRNQSADGDGVYIAMQTTLAGQVGGPTATITYTNSAGTGGRVATNIMGTGSSPGLGSTYIFGLQAGDTGVRSVQDFTLSVTWTAGNISLMAFRPIAYIPNPVHNGPPNSRRNRVEDAITLCAPRIWNGSVLELWAVHQSVTSGTIIGSISISQG